MAKHGKNFTEARKKLSRTQHYTFEQGVGLALDSSYAKFDESVDVSVRLGVDPRHADQMIRGTVVLPHGTGKSVIVAVFAQGEKEKEALDAGADFVGGAELADKIKGGWMEFDRCVATPDMMATAGKLGKILGPRGLMPNTKSGTVTFDLEKTIKEIKAGKIEFRVDKAGIVHAPLGKKSFGVQKIQENLETVVETLMRMKPSSAKGTYMKAISISTTMGPGVKLDSAEVKALMARA